MPDRYDLLDMDNKLIWNLRDIGHTLRRTYEGRGSQQRILIVLLEMGVLSQSALTQHLGVKPGSASEVLIKLETSGLIVRAPSPDDHRTMLVSLSDKGRHEAREAKRRREQRHKQMFVGLSEEEKTMLLTLLEKLNSAWEAACFEKNQEQFSDTGA